MPVAGHMCCVWTPSTPPRMRWAAFAVSLRAFVGRSWTRFGFLPCLLRGARVGSIQFSTPAMGIASLRGTRMGIASLRGTRVGVIRSFIFRFWTRAMGTGVVAFAAGGLE